MAEVSFQLDAIHQSDPELPVDGLHVACGERDVCFRLPTYTDLIAIASARDEGTARQALAMRCVLRDTGQSEELDEETLAAMSTSMATADPQAEVELSVTCPNCADTRLAAFVIGDFLWREVATWATGLLRDVHTLAARYGWLESDVLALSPRRRQLYVEMALA